MAMLQKSNFIPNKRVMSWYASSNQDQSQLPMLKIGISPCNLNKS